MKMIRSVSIRMRGNSLEHKSCPSLPRKLITSYFYWL